MSTQKYLPENTSTENLYLAIFDELPEYDMEKNDLEALFDALNTLAPREADIIMRYFGIGKIENLTFFVVFPLLTKCQAGCLSLTALGGIRVSLGVK